MGDNFCHSCKHIRQRVLPELELTSITSDTLRIRSEWNADWSRREHDEWQRVLARDVFADEPYFYPWCELLTRVDAQGAAKRVDRHGRRVRHYALCLAVNPDATCNGHSRVREAWRNRRRSDRERRS